MPRFFVHTLGCKFNQADSADAEGLLRRADYEPTEDPAQADLILLNTCTVTGRADAEGRRLLRMYRRLNPRARIVATGCYAERDAAALWKTGAVDAVVPLRERGQIGTALLGEASCAPAPLPLLKVDRARAYLKVQEGCDLRCSYCIIPAVRGPSRSVPAESILAQARRQAEQGVLEIGLTGINTGAWGNDLSPRRRLADLLEELLALDLPARFRLNSLEPRTVDRGILDLIAAAPERLVPHIQIPLQSGSDRILARMARNYRTEFYREVVEEAHAAVPGICLGADVITAFPGETDDDHQQTRDFLAGLPLAYLHVFSYSPRPGTRAAGFEEPVAAPQARARTAEVRALGARMSRTFRERMLGQEIQVLTLDAEEKDGSRRALSGNYVEVLLPGTTPAGRLLRVVPTALEQQGRVVRAELRP